MGLPNTGSRDFGWPGVDLNADPSFDDVLAQSAVYADAFTRYINERSITDLPESVEVLENGTARPSCVSTWCSKRSSNTSATRSATSTCCSRRVTSRGSRVSGRPQLR